MATPVPNYSFTFPLPDNALSKNARGTWRQKRTAWRKQRDDAVFGIMSQHRMAAPIHHSVRIAVEWRFARGVQPDFDNAIARMSPIFDALEQTGILEDDRLIAGVDIDWQRVKVGNEALQMHVSKQVEVIHKEE